ncbi:MAG: hypothetical protein JEY94_08335 [Melioribacteraceae bacterium]|nr:hypothetical protein [Melioribacteraceae bacterium]
MSKKTVLFYLLSLTIIFFIGCEEEKKDPETIAELTLKMSVNSCEGCHTNYEHLKTVHTPDPPSTEAAGCGGEAPHFEPYDRVFLGGDGFTQFKSGIHGKLDCVACHNGVDGTDDKVLAHSDNFITHPSLVPEEKCASCHPDIVQRTQNSIHREGSGQKSMVSQRYGAGNGLDAFESLPHDLKEGYDANCAKCHGTCGDCHIVRPKAGGGGLKSGHAFIRTPDMVNTCVTCHVSRGGHAYLGVASGTVPDVHLTKAGYNCLDCHSQNEVHGDGKYVDQRYKMSLKPECEDCHSNLEEANNYHKTHLSTFNCQTCHSQDYNNCGSCHIPGLPEEGALAKVSGGVGARIASYQGFKIGMNPLKTTSKPQYKMALLRRSLSAPDSWSGYGVENLSNFDVAPTFKYTTPHNIIKWTTRTGFKNDEGNWEGYAKCYDGCHIIAEGDSLRNKGLYLFNEDLEDWELNADKDIVVDGKLPAWWGVN